MSRQKKFPLTLVLRSIAAWLVTLLLFFPLGWLVLTAFKTELQAIAQPPLLVFPPTLDNFAEVQSRSDYLLYAGNSLITSVASTLLGLALAAPAAYSMAFFRSARTKDILMWMLSTKMMPAVGALVPIYVLAQFAGLLDTRLALVIVFTLSNLPIMVWMLFSAFKEIPSDILEAARMDGATLWQEARQVLLPLTMLLNWRLGLVLNVLIVVFAGGRYLAWFPLRGLVSDDFDTLSLGGKILDYLWHITLPVTAMVLGSFAVTAMLTKNAFLEEIRKQYVVTARAKGLGERRVLWKHVFRNALIPIVTGFPAAFIGAFFTGSLLIETLFSLDGLGLLSYESVIRRDYPVVLGTLFLFTLIGLVTKLISDLCYVWVDPRVKFD